MSLEQSAMFARCLRAVYQELSLFEACSSLCSAENGVSMSSDCEYKEVRAQTSANKLGNRAALLGTERKLHTCF